MQFRRPTENLRVLGTRSVETAIGLIGLGRVTNLGFEKSKWNEENTMSRPISFLTRTAMCGLLLLFIVITASAQFRAGIQGSVVDATGALVPQATVTLTSKETNKPQQTTSSDSGFYSFKGLAPGSYSITAEKAGYRKEVLETVTVDAESVQGINLILQAGDIAATVTVSGDTTPAIETENSNIAKTVTTEEVRQLPQSGRDPYELTRLTPGVFGDFARSSGGNAQNLPNQKGPGGTAANRLIFQTENSPQITANGQRVESNNYQIDGTSVNSLTFGGAAVITPNQESVKEIRVIASVYSAEYGRNSGAQVLTVSKNGTNQFHGSLFLKNNSPGLNSANAYGGPGPNGTSLPGVANIQHYNQYGGSIGGPIPLPRFGEGPPSFHLEKNKAFFFFSYEGLRNNSVSTSNQFITTPQFQQQVLSLRPGSVTAAILGASGSSARIISVIPVTCAFAGFSPGSAGRPCQQVAGGLDIGSPALSTGQYIPSVTTGNYGGGGLDGIPDIEYALIGAPNFSKGNQYNARFDFNLTQKDTLTFSSYISKLNAVISDTTANQGATPLGDVTIKPSNYFATLAYSRILSSTMTNEARVNLTRFVDNQLVTSSNTNFGIPRIEIQNIGIPGRLFFGAPLAETTPGIFAENTYEFRDTLRKSIGSHAFSFGVEMRKEQNNNNLLGGARPDFVFEGLFNFVNGTPIFEGINIDPRNGGVPDAQRYFRTNAYALFAQDDWKFRPNLTVNLGLRWDYFTPLREKNGRLTNFVVGPPGQELVGGRQVPVTDFYKRELKDFAPRLGFAWSPTRIAGLNTANKLVVRGGFGIAYDRIPVNDFENSRDNPPNLARLGICCGTEPTGFSTPFAGGSILYALGATNSPLSYPANPLLALTFGPNGIPDNGPFGANLTIYGSSPDTKTPYIYSYSLDAQYELPAKLTGEVGYQGSASRHLVRLIDLRNLYRTNFNASIFFPLTDTNANYNALIVRLSRRFGRGFQFDGNYRWSKSIDIVSSETVGAANPTFISDLSQERGPSDYDVRHSLVFSGLWELPIFRARKDLVGKVLGGWQLSGIATFHTGFPWTPVIGNCPTNNAPVYCPARPTAYFGGAGTDTSNNAFITGSNFPGGGTKFFSTIGALGPAGVAGLSNVNPGIGRNSFRGPKYRDVDLSLAKRFGLPSFFGEGANLEIKANFFNAFNILNLAPFGYASSSTTITDPNFGRAQSALSGRIIEFQGRFTF
jgi:outer membrane receptor protein involved in Fe transport